MCHVLCADLCMSVVRCSVRVLCGISYALCMWFRLCYVRALVCVFFVHFEQSDVCARTRVTIRAQQNVAQ